MANENLVVPKGDENKAGKAVRTFDIDIAYRDDGALASDLGSIIEQARSAAYRAVDVVLVYRNWLIGKRIAEEELKGAGRAAYGTSQLATLADELTVTYGKGFDSSNCTGISRFLRDFQFLTHCVQNLEHGLAGLITVLYYKLKAMKHCAGILMRRRRRRGASGRFNATFHHNIMNGHFSHNQRILSVAR